MLPDAKDRTVAESSRTIRLPDRKPAARRGWQAWKYSDSFGRSSNELRTRQPSRQCHRRPTETLYQRTSSDRKPSSFPGIHDNRLQPLHNSCPPRRTETSWPMASPGFMVSLLRDQSDRPRRRIVKIPGSSVRPDRTIARSKNGFRNLTLTTNAIQSAFGSATVLRQRTMPPMG